jgi:hypothetical protein
MEAKKVNIQIVKLRSRLLKSSLIEPGPSFFFVFPSLLLDYNSYLTTIMNSRSLQGTANVQVTFIDKSIASKDGANVFL